MNEKYTKKRIFFLHTKVFQVSINLKGVSVLRNISFLFFSRSLFISNDTLKNFFLSYSFSITGLMCFPGGGAT